MKIALIGMPKSGKTTIFNALTGLQKEVGAFTSPESETHHGIVEVHDTRVSWLADHYKPKKTIYATIEYMDFAGMSSGSEREEGFSAQIQVGMKTADALALVVRNFEDDIINDIAGPLQQLHDISTLEEEMLISDQILVEKRLEKIDLAYKRGQKTPQLQIEEKVLKSILVHLEQSKPIRTMSLAEEEDKAVRGFQFLSQKPVLIILNSDENHYRKDIEIIDKIKTQYPFVEFAGKFEMELAGLTQEEAKMFMDDMGIEESARDLLTRFSYQTLGYVSFFTVGPDEVRAWTISNQENAVDAAGKIHSDLARGFIRAECFSYDDLFIHGSEKVLREKGLFRLEGKNYIVKDGDILNIRFSV
jgi:ribosome-binding ATPase